MYCIRPVTDDLTWIGGSDRQTPIFEAAHPVPRGMAYNSYLLLDEKTVLFDTVDRSIEGQFFENLEHVLNGRPLDYVFVHHMEPDHAATLGDLMVRHPETQIVCNGKSLNMIRQFHCTEPHNPILMKEGDSICTGKHTYTFYNAPMVHWPEVMVSYDSVDKILFSADAFGTFGALNGILFADEVNFDRDWLDEARRYYTNIVGKYGPQTTALLKKAAGLDIRMICPLHGPIWRKDLGYIIDKYTKWGAYEPEEQGVLIAFASVYGDTEIAANILACRLAELGIKVDMYDVSITHPSYVLSECFRYSHIVFASTTYNNGIFVTMENLLHDVAAHNLQNRKVALIQNGSWSPNSGKLMTEIVESMKNMEILQAPVTLKSALAPGQDQELEALAQLLAADIKGEPEAEEPAVEEAPAEEAPAAPGKIKGYVCGICGFIFEGDTLPDDYVCPLCHAPASMFSPLYEEEPQQPAPKEEPAPEQKAKGFVCGICGFIYDGETLPDDYVCPLCHAPASMFSPVE